MKTTTQKEYDVEQLFMLTVKLEQMKRKATGYTEENMIELEIDDEDSDIEV